MILPAATINPNPELKDALVVAIIGFAMQGEQEKALASGCDGYITKPIEFQHVLNTIDEFYQKLSEQDFIGDFPVHIPKIRNRPLKGPVTYFLGYRI